MTKFEKIFNRLTWICMVAGIASGIYGATHGEQPTWLTVFLLYAFCVITYSSYTWARYIMSKDDDNGM